MRGVPDGGDAPDFPLAHARRAGGRVFASLMPPTPMTVVMRRRTGHGARRRAQEQETGRRGPIWPYGLGRGREKRFSNRAAQSGS